MKNITKGAHERELKNSPKEGHKELPPWYAKDWSNDFDLEGDWGEIWE